MSIDPAVLHKLRKYCNDKGIKMKISELATIYKFSIENHSNVRVKRIVKKFKELKKEGSKGICGEVRTVLNPVTLMMEQIPRKGTHYKCRLEKFGNVIRQMIKDGESQKSIAEKIGATQSGVSNYVRRHHLGNNAHVKPTLRRVVIEEKEEEKEEGKEGDEGEEEEEIEEEKEGEIEETDV